MPAEKFWELDYWGGQAGGGVFESVEAGPLQRSPDGSTARAGAYGAGVLVASFSAIGRLGKVATGRKVCVTGAPSLGDGAAVGAAIGAEVTVPMGASGGSRSTAGA